MKCEKMKCEIYQKGVFIILLLNILTNCFSMSFESDRISKTYNLLPINLKSNIDSLNFSKEICWDDSCLSSIRVIFNKYKEITHLGYNLKKENFIKSEYIEGYRFVELCFLNLLLIKSDKERYEYIEQQQLKFYLNNKLIQLDTKNIAGLFANLIKLKFSFSYYDDQFEACWTESNGKQFKIRFPNNLYLIKGMDKVDMELSFLKNLKQNTESEINFKINTEKIKRIDKKMFLQVGKFFETDNFRSDIYLEKTNGAASFKPCFSKNYPVESFSNLFICNLPNSFNSKVDFRFYKNKVTREIQLNKLLENLSNNKEVYFGVYSTTETKIKATVIYYDRLYKYIHMLIAEAENDKLFTDKNAELKIILYLYIPREEVDYKKLDEKFDLSYSNFQFYKQFIN